MGGISSVTRRRLLMAALDLYSERGYDETTAAQIAERAGFTERTFFRQFADKREVLFEVEDHLRIELSRALDAVPSDVPPLEALLEAFLAMVPVLEADRDLSVRRHRIIAVTPRLAERELAKAAMLTGVEAKALRARGISERRASLLAQIGSAALGQSLSAWLDDPEVDLGATIVATFAELRDIFAL